MNSDYLSEAAEFAKRNKVKSVCILNGNGAHRLKRRKKLDKVLQKINETTRNNRYDSK